MNGVRCRNCGAEDFIPRYVNYGFCDAQTGIPTCPSCGSEEIESGYSCSLCGRYAVDEICDNCADNLRERFHELLEENFTPAEIKALNVIYDGKDIE